MLLHILKVTVALVFLVFAGCVSVKKIVGPDGTENHLIACYEIEDCYSKAREVCGGNYKIVNTNSETSGVNGQTSTATKLLVKCER